MFEATFSSTCKRVHVDSCLRARITINLGCVPAAPSVRINVVARWWYVRVFGVFQDEVDHLKLNVSALLLLVYLWVCKPVRGMRLATCFWLKIGWPLDRHPRPCCRAVSGAAFRPPRPQKTRNHMATNQIVLVNICGVFVPQTDVFHTLMYYPMRVSTYWYLSYGN